MITHWSHPILQQESHYKLYKQHCCTHRTVAHLLISNLVEVAVMLVGVAQPSEQLNTLLNSVEEIGE